MIKEFIDNFIFVALTVWFLITSIVIFMPSSAVLMVGKHRHIIVVYTESNNSKLQDEFTKIIEEHTKVTK